MCQKPPLFSVETANNASYQFLEAKQSYRFYADLNRGYCIKASDAF